MNQTWTPFDREKKEHRLICIGALHAADQFGVGRITACKEALESENIRAYSTPKEQDAFQVFIQEIGR